jgi:hypothetical protein
MRSAKILAVSRTPDSVALTDSDIFWLEKNETAVSASDATKSRLLSGVMGGADFGFFLRRPKPFFTPGTGWLQM